MTVGALFLLAAGLAMDAVAVAAACALANPHVRGRGALIVAVWFGGFQALMPAIGWVAGSRLGPLLERWDHWVVFLVLAGLGLKMIREAVRHHEADGPAAPEQTHVSPFAARTMATLALATSIDALATGVALPLMGANLWLAVSAIGLTTGVLCAVGYWAARWLGSAAGRRLEVIGGAVLVGLGIKVLVQHLQSTV